MLLDYAAIQRKMAVLELRQRCLAHRMERPAGSVSKILQRIRAGKQVRPDTAGGLARALDCDVTEIEGRA